MKPHANLHAMSNPLMALRATASAQTPLQDAVSNGAVDTGFASIMAQQLTHAVPGDQALTDLGESDPCLSMCDALKNDDEVALQPEQPLAMVPMGAEGMVWAAPVVAVPDADTRGGAQAVTSDMATDTDASPIPLFAAQTLEPKDRANVLQTVAAGVAPVAETSEQVTTVVGRDRNPVPAADTASEPSISMPAVPDKSVATVLPRAVNDTRLPSVGERSVPMARPVMSSAPERSGRTTVQWVQSAQTAQSTQSAHALPDAAQDAASAPPVQAAQAMPGTASARGGGQVADGRDPLADTSKAVTESSVATARATEPATTAATTTTARTPASSARMERERPLMDLSQPDAEKTWLETTEVASQAAPKRVDSSRVDTVQMDTAQTNTASTAGVPSTPVGVSLPRQLQGPELADTLVPIAVATTPTLTRVASGHTALTLENLLANAPKAQRATPSTVDAFASRAVQRTTDDKAGQPQLWGNSPTAALSGQAPEPALAASLTPSRPVIENAPAELSRQGERLDVHEAVPHALPQPQLTGMSLPVASFVRHESAALQQTVGTPAFTDELIGQVKVWVKQATDEGPMTAELHLNPADMGPVMVRIEVDGQVAQVNFAAQHAETRQAIEASLSMLSASLEEAGIQLSGSDVSDQGTSSQQAWGFDSRGDGQSRQSSQAFATASEQGQTGLRPQGDRVDDDAWRQTPVSRSASSATGLDLYA